MLMFVPACSCRCVALMTQESVFSRLHYRGIGAVGGAGCDAL